MTRHTPRPGRAVILVGTTLIALNTAAGVIGMNSWPISGFPTFAPTPPPIATVISMEFTQPDGRVDSLITGQANPALPAGSERLNGLVTAVANLPSGPRRDEALRALMAMYADAVPSMSTASSVTFYRDQFNDAPEDQGQAPIHRDVLFRIDR